MRVPDHATYVPPPEGDDARAFHAACATVRETIDLTKDRPVFRGHWKATETYLFGDVVLWEGSSWVATKDHPGKEPNPAFIGPWLRYRSSPPPPHPPPPVPGVAIQR